MPSKVVLEAGDSLDLALKRLRSLSKKRGVLLGRVEIEEQNRRKDYHQKPGVKRRQKRYLRSVGRSVALRRLARREASQPDFIAWG